MFRNRKLTDDTNIYEYNAWDNVSINDEKLCQALEKIKLDNKNENTQKYEQSQESWERFYRKHNDNFFKDRKWIEQEFNDIQNYNKILEVGCGVGNSLAWLYKKNKEENNEGKNTRDDKNNDQKMIFGCDFSQKAIKIAQKRFPYFHFFVHDICSDKDIFDDIKTCGLATLEGNNLMFDCVIFIYTMSAIDPRLYDNIIQKIYKILKPGGKIFFKDYSFLDMIQMRYKRDQIVAENFYRRQDGTFTYFFKIDELQTLFEKHGFTVKTLFEDKRMKINRKTKVEMYRIMLQGVFVKEANG